MLMLLMAGSAETVVAQPMVVQRLEKNVEAGEIRGWLAKVDVHDQRLEVIVTAARGSDDVKIDGDGNDKDANQPALKGSASEELKMMGVTSSQTTQKGTASQEAVLLPTDEWARQVGAVLAINANFFAKQGDGAADIIGLSISDGVIVSPPRKYQGMADPALMIDKQGTIRVGLIDATQLEEAWLAVAGVGASESDPTRGGLLVHEGRNQGKSARVEPLTRHPRTAIGTDAQGRWLYVLVIDGRQPHWSIGATLEETAAILIDYGATEAINLDGGGSTSFYYDPQKMRTMQNAIDEKVLTNRPSDGVFRPVANHLGVRWRDSNKE